MSKHLGWYWLEMTPLYWLTHITLSSSSTIMSHYPGVTVLVRFLLFNVFVCLFVCWYLSCLSVCIAVCMSYLSMCVHNFVLYCGLYMGLWPKYNKPSEVWSLSYHLWPAPTKAAQSRWLRHGYTIRHAWRSLVAILMEFYFFRFFYFQLLWSFVYHLSAYNSSIQRIKFLNVWFTACDWSKVQPEYV